MALWLLAICWYICAGPHRKLCRFGTSVIHKVAQSCALVWLFIKYFALFNNAFSYESVCSTLNFSWEIYHRIHQTYIYIKKICLSLHLKYFITVMSYQDLHVCVRLCYTLDHSSGLKLYFFRRTDFKWLAGVPKRLVQRERELFRPLSSGSLEPGQ